MEEANTLQRSFEELIKQRNWYKDSGIDRKTAYRDKLYFLNGELSEKKIRHYLSKAGYSPYQEELWIKNIEIL